jgi:hypothetical protein
VQAVAAVVCLQPGAPVTGDARVVPRRVSATAEHVDTAPRHPHATHRCRFGSGWICLRISLRRLKSTQGRPGARKGTRADSAKGGFEYHPRSPPSRLALTLGRYGGQPSSGLMNRSAWLDDPPSIKTREGWLASRSSLMDAGERRLVDQTVIEPARALPSESLAGGRFWWAHLEFEPAIIELASRRGRVHISCRSPW